MSVQLRRNPHLQAMRLAETAFGPEHPLLGEVLLPYATFLRAQGRGKAARAVEQKALAILRKSGQENRLGLTVEASALVPHKTPRTKARRGFDATRKSPSGIDNQTLHKQ